MTSTTTSSARPRTHRFAGLDALRGVAALGVVAFHAGQTANSNELWWGAPFARLNIGVTLFFLLSGFVIYRPFVAARLRGVPSPSLGTYAMRRVARIVPGYWVALTVVLVLGLAGSAQPAWVLYLFGQVYTADDAFTGLSPAWTLCVELSFYALLPLHALVATRIARRTTPRRALAGELGALAALSVAVVVLRALTLTPGVFPALHFTLLGTADWFALGMALALVSAHAERGGRPAALLEAARRRTGACWAGALATFALCTLLIDLETSATRVAPASWLIEHIGFGIVTLLVLLPLAAPGSAALVGPARVLAARPLAWLGTVSYGIYLWHLPVVWRLGPLDVGPGPVGLVLVTLAGVALTLPLAAASWHLVERPAMELARQRMAGERPQLRRAWPILRRAGLARG